MTGATVREALDSAVDALGAMGIDRPRLDAELLLGAAMGCERAVLMADSGVEVRPPAARLFGEMVRRRLRREPVAYILGRRGFRNLELEIDRRVLIPRPETELLVELAVEMAPGSVLDVGTGSGAIALAVADELLDCAVTATDTSPRALEVGRANAERLGLADRVRFLEGTLPEDESFDLLLANLPYVAERDWPTLQPEVTQWEPREALLAGPDGLDAYRALFSPDRVAAFARMAKETGNSAGWSVAVEVGEGQAGVVSALMREAGLGAIEVRRDLAGIERVVIGSGRGMA